MWRFLEKVNIELPYDPEIPLLGIHPEKTIIQKDTGATVFIAALFTMARTWKQPVSINRQINKEDVVHIYKGIFFTIKGIKIGPGGWTYHLSYRVK